MELLAPEEARRPGPSTEADGSRPHQEAFDRALDAKRRTPAPAEDADGAPEDRAHGEVLCPYCLEGIQLDLGRLFVTDDQMQYRPWTSPVSATRCGART